MHNFATHSNEATTSTKRTILGVVGYAVNSQGSTILSHAAGATHLDEAAAHPIDVNAAFPLASSTKLITAIAALRLVEQGKLNLDDATVVEDHLPELCQQPIITSHSPECTFEPRKHGITVRHLMTHTSGSSFDLIDPTLRAWRASRNEPPMSLTAPLPKALEMPGVFQPGEGWRYGGGLDWTGLLISRLTGMTLGEFMRKEIFDVVGCDSNIGFSRTEIEKSGIIVQCATVNPAGELEAHHNPDMPSERGGGGLFASAANYIKILADLISPESKLLKPESVDLLFTPQLSANPKALNDLKNSSRIFGAMTGPLTASLSPTGMDHALGGLLIMEDNEALGKTKGTMTWGGAFSSLWFASRERGIAAFYGSSMFPPAQGVTKDLMEEFVSEVWSKG